MHINLTEKITTSLRENSSFFLLLKTYIGHQKQTGTSQKGGLKKDLNYDIIIWIAP